MTEPQAYERQGSLAGLEGGGQLEREFDAIKAALDQVLAKLAQLPCEGGADTSSPEDGRVEALNVTDAGVDINVAATAGLWNDFGPRPNVVRLNDRLMVGKSATEYSNNYAGPFPDNAFWKIANGAYAHLMKFAQAVISSNFGVIALLGMARSGDSPAIPGGAPETAGLPVAVGAFTINDNVKAPQGAWGFFCSTLRLPGTGAIVNEIDVLNATTNVVKYTPYSFPTDVAGHSVGLAIQSGGPGAYPSAGMTFSASSTALLISGYGSTWEDGIVFRDGSISNRDAAAITMPAGYSCAWTHDASGAIDAFMTSVVSDNRRKMGWVMSDFGALLADSRALGTVYHQFEHVVSAVSRPVFSPAVIGQPVEFSAIGPAGESVGVHIAAQGDGGVSFSKLMVPFVTTPPNATSVGEPGEI